MWLWRFGKRPRRLRVPLILIGFLYPASVSPSSTPLSSNRNTYPRPPSAAQQLCPSSHLANASRLSSRRELTCDMPSRMHVTREWSKAAKRTTLPCTGMMAVGRRLPAGATPDAAQRVSKMHIMLRPTHTPLITRSFNGNTVRNFPTHGQLSAVQGSLTSCLNFDFAILNMFEPSAVV
jgi:hypothetical protein